jgi:hypothetical protein
MSCGKQPIADSQRQATPAALPLRVLTLVGGNKKFTETKIELFHVYPPSKDFKAVSGAAVLSAAVSAAPPIPPFLDAAAARAAAALLLMLCDAITGGAGGGGGGVGAAGVLGLIKPITCLQRGCS